MDVRIKPGMLNGTLRMPPSKSVMQRVCAIIWAKGGSILIHNPGYSEDDQVMLQILRSSGATIIQKDNGSILIETVPAATHTMRSVHFGASGLAARMCLPILALSGSKVMIESAETLSSRPMQLFGNVLPKLGVSIAMHNGRFPATISGKLQPRDIDVDGSISSQFITGLLIAYASAGANNVRIAVRNLVSRPYIRLTLDIMEAMSLNIPEWRKDDIFYFNEAPNLQQSGLLHFTVDGDWSAAAFWLVASAVAGPLIITGLNVFTTQGDKAVLQAIMDCGASMSIESDKITVAPVRLKAFQFDATDTPDLFPPLAALATYCEGSSVIQGVSRLAGKESNRAVTIVSELTKMGADISVQNDLMIIKGGIPLHGARVNAHSDHRIAMMCAVAGLGATEEIIITGAEAVRKSYPNFFEDLQSAGGRILISG